LHTRTSIDSRAASTWRMSDSTANRSLMSQGATKAVSLPLTKLARVRSSFARSRPTSATRSPLSASVLAMLWPIPLPAPVTSAVFKFAVKAISSRGVLPRQSRSSPDARLARPRGITASHCTVRAPVRRPMIVDPNEMPLHDSGMANLPESGKASWYSKRRQPRRPGGHCGHRLGVHFRKSRSHGPIRRSRSGAGWSPARRCWNSRPSPRPRRRRALRQPTGQLSWSRYFGSRRPHSQADR
jgi:hypothetical protein